MFHHFQRIPSTFHGAKSKNLNAFFSRQQPQQQNPPRKISARKNLPTKSGKIRKGKQVVSLLEFLLLQLLGIVNATHFWHQAISTLHAIQRPSSSSTQQRERLDLETAMKHDIGSVNCVYTYIVLPLSLVMTCKHGHYGILASSKWWTTERHFDG